MNRSSLIYSGLIAGCLLLFTGCSQAPTETLIAATPTIAAATEVIPTAAPTPTATETPVLPCNIAFEADRDNNHEIYVMAPDGSGQTNLTNNPADDNDPVWSPDGTYIAFVSNRPSEEGDGQYLYMMLADGSDVKQISHQPDSQWPDWSPLGGQIVYSSKGDIYLINVADGSEVNLTNSPEKDEQPKFSPDGQRIAWIKGDGEDTHLFVMNLDGGNVQQVTEKGKVDDLAWSVDGRIFTHWQNPEGICFNCVVTADGKKVEDAGGKGTIQQFLPFWTVEGDRVELVSGDIKGTGREDIFLVSEKFPDMFKFLTENSGNNRNEDTAAMCGPTHGLYPQYGAEANILPTNEPQGEKFVIGYTGSIDPIMQRDFDTACAELDVECVKGKDISELINKGVDAIVNASNRWDVMGSYPAIHEASVKGIPLFMLNAESSEPGVYNLSAENEIYTTALKFMFKEMGDKGEFVYYNFGNSEYIQNIIDKVLKEFPEVTAIKKDADFNGNSFTQQDIVKLIAEDANLKAIWSTEQLNDIFWGIVDKGNSHTPLTECLARKDELIAWKNEIDAGSTFKCIAFVRPGGTAYEGIYVAYYYLNGLQFNPDKLTGEAGNTLKYSVPEITNESLPEWLGKIDSFQEGSYGILQLSHMDPAQIKAEWFIK